MRGTDERSGKLFSYVDLEQRVPARHPLRAIRGLVNGALADIGPELEAVYSRIGRPSIAPEKLLRALLLQLFHGIRSERQMMERLDFDLSFRWFVGLGVDDPVWDASTFSKNRERLLDGEIDGALPVGDPGAAAGEAPAVDRAFLGGRYVDRGMVQHEELSSQERRRSR
jgi:transposase